VAIVPALLLLLALGGCSASPPEVRDGDLIFHTSRSSQSVAIQKATRSKYSHMGVIFLRKGKPFVYEAVSTVKYTPLDAWIDRGSGGRYVVKRLRDSHRILTPVAIEKLRKQARELEGRPYDLTFGWSDDRMYCSELVWKLYDRAMGVQIGRLQKIEEFDLSDPAVRAKMRERYGSNLPQGETVISPVSMFESPRLVVVKKK
jgi:hypothetical protein